MSYFNAWMVLIQQRDTLYLELFSAVFVGLTWYWLGYKFLNPKWAYWLTLLSALLVVGLAQAWAIGRLLYGS